MKVLLQLGCVFTVSLMRARACPPPFLPSRVNHSSNEEGHVGPVAPQQEDKRLQGREGVVRAREGGGGDGHGLHAVLGQREDASVADGVQNQPVFRVKAAQVGVLKERRQP